MEEINIINGFTFHGFLTTVTGKNSLTKQHYIKYIYQNHNKLAIVIRY